jgi:hypothetical protein
VFKYLKLCEQLTSNYNSLIKTITDIGDLINGMAQSTKNLNEELPGTEVNNY